MIVSDDGFVGILDKNKETVLEFLNIFCASDPIENPFQRVSDPDIISFAWNANLSKISFDKYFLTRRNYIANDRYKKESDFSTFERDLVRPLKLRNYLDNATKLMDDPHKTEYLLLGEAMSLNFDELYKPSFLLAWMVIESIISEKWREYVASITKSGIETNTLEAFTKWEVSRYIKFLFEINEIEKNKKEELDSLRELRNSIIHKKTNVTQEQAVDCVFTAFELLTDKK